MKRCPECRCDYYDDTLSFCLADGSELVYGLADDEPATAILSEPASSAVRSRAGTDQAQSNTVLLQPTADAAVAPWYSKRNMFLGVGIALLAIGALGYGIFQYSNGQKRSSPVSLEMKLTRLTTSGKATVAAISPDGKYVVHAIDDNGQQSLWMRQTATQSNVQIVPPASDINYGRLIFSPDGNYLFYTAAAERNVPATAILSEPGAVATGIPTDKLPGESPTIQRQPPSTAGGSDSAKRRSWALAAALLLLMTGGIGFAVYKFWGKSDKTLSFQTAKFQRLTTTGKASGVAISPDGKYVVHVQDDGGQQSLWTRQVATQSNVQIVEPAAVNYTGLSVSPDGNYIYYRVFSQEFSRGALFQLPTLGGTPKKLLENLSASPVTFSPDGKQVAFIRQAPGIESALMIANDDGTGERKLLSYKNPPEAMGSPAWSPDGNRIAYVLSNLESNDQTIFEVSIADGSTKSLTPQRWLRVSRLTWLADGGGILMLATPGQSFVFQIWKLSYPTGEAQALTNDLNTYPEMSLAASSGTLAVVESETNASIWVAPAGNVASAQPITSGAGKADLLPAWTPDGRIVYHSNAGGINDIWITGSDGASPKQLTANSRLNEGPVVSPDGRYIVFLSDRGGTPHLWRMNIDGGDPRQLTSGATGEQNPAFSPDGRWLVYRTSAANTTIWKIPIEGGDPLQLSHKFSLSPRFSPDGKFLAYFLRDDNAPWRIAVASVDGGEPVKLFELSMPSGSPNLRWTPDGRAIAYTKTTNGVTNIVAQPLDGGRPYLLTDFKNDRIFSFDYSPDGKRLALSRGTVTNDVVLISNFK